MPLKMYEHSLDRINNTIGVLGGKGGVGKSTVAINLALALKAKGRKVGILDADIYGPSIKHLLGGDGLPGKEGEFIFPAKAQEISLISMAFFGAKDEASIVRAPIANQIIQQFLGKMRWGDLDDLLIDFPPGTGDIQITLMQLAKLTGVVVVTTPQEVALLDVRKSIQMCQEMNVPILGVVENMSYLLHEGERIHPFGEGGGRQLADDYGVPLLGQIPLEPRISSLGDEGRSIFEAKIPVCKQFEEAAARVVSLLEALRGPSPLVRIEEGGKYFEIKWPDGEEQRLSVSEVQCHCPCVRCKEKEYKAKEGSEVLVKEIKLLGNFGFRIAFSTGCSKGIYPFKLLRRVGAG